MLPTATLAEFTSAVSVLAKFTAPLIYAMAPVSRWKAY